MNYKVYSLLALVGLLLAGCRSTQQNDDIVSQRYVHKYGYAVSQAEWDAKDYPGQVITHLRNGVTITATYENGVLHGLTTHTFPHSQTVEHSYLYNQGAKVKETRYSAEGLPMEERVQLSPSRQALTMWYRQGSPMLIEEFLENELLEGQYFTLDNELESRIEKGNGARVRRTIEGLLLSKEEFSQGFLIKKETFHPNGLPESIAYYQNGKLQGEKRTFGSTGEPVAIEEYIDDKLHGVATYFNNGQKYLEISYLYGQRNGLEKHYVDGHILTEEIAWEDDLKHGCHRLYVDNTIEQRWFYAGDTVSQKRFAELNRLDAMISQISPEFTDNLR